MVSVYASGSGPTESLGQVHKVSVAGLGGRNVCLKNQSSNYKTVLSLNWAKSFNIFICSYSLIPLIVNGRTI